MVNSYNYPDGVSLHCLWNISVSSICFPQFNFKRDSSGRLNQILVFARAWIVNFVIRNLNNSEKKTLHKFRQQCVSKVGKNNCAWKLSKPSTVAGTSFIWVGIFFSRVSQATRDQNRTLTDELVVFNSTGSERSKFHYSEQKVTWSSLNASLLLCGLYVFEWSFLGLSDRRKRRAETRSRFTQPCLKPWERGWYFTRFVTGWCSAFSVGCTCILRNVLACPKLKNKIRTSEFLSLAGLFPPRFGGKLR